MAYTPDTLIAFGPRMGSGPVQWQYNTTDPHATVAGADYFSDGAQRGLATNDSMIVVDSNANTCTIHRVVNSTTIAAATLA